MAMWLAAPVVVTGAAATFAGTSDRGAGASSAKAALLRASAETNNSDFMTISFDALVSAM